MAYFDAASAEPVSPAAREALLAALDDGWADPVRLHREGRRASLLLDQARERVAGVVRSPPGEIPFSPPGPHAGQLPALWARRCPPLPPRRASHAVVPRDRHTC